MPSYKYSRWDGSQQPFGQDVDRLMDSLSDDVLAHGDLNRALRSMFHRGFEDEDGQRIDGLRELRERLRAQRQLQLERYNLDPIMDDLKERLQDVIDTERKGIRGRVQEAREQLEQVGDESGHLREPMRLLEERARDSSERLDTLPESPAGAIKDLTDYEFMDPEAHRKFQELLETLQQQMLQSFFQGMRQQLQDMSPEQLEDLKNMVQALNQMLQDRAMGLDPDFEGFMEDYGHHFDPDRPTSLDELLERLGRQMQAAQSLMDSMSPEMRSELESLMQASMDPGLLDELSELAYQMEQLFPSDQAREYPFMGDESVTLDQAMDLMGDLQQMDDLDRQVQEVMRSGKVEELDPDKVGELAGEEARRQLERLQQVVQQLEEAGYLRRDGDRLDLTPRGIRKLAERAMTEVFSQLKKDRIGAHEVMQGGDGGEKTGETKRYEFGAPFDIDLPKTLFNSVLRQGPEVPIRMRPEDLEISRTEHMSDAATVLLLDQSRSMGMLGSFASAKKVALALYWLIHSRFPRDRFAVIGFSDYAMEIDTEHLPEVSWNAWVSGTNMHHAFMLSRKILAKQKTATKQILMITDGEPTAHIEDGQAYFNYPPSYRTISETLKEVKRCTQEGITINTFMLETSYYLMDFIDKMTRINRGRAFCTTPGQLGRYVMVDYLKNRRKRVA